MSKKRRNPAVAALYAERFAPSAWWTTAPTATPPVTLCKECGLAVDDTHECVDCQTPVEVEKPQVTAVTSEAAPAAVAAASEGLTPHLDHNERSATDAG